MQVSKILIDGREKLALVDDRAPLVAAARLLRDRATNLAVVCDASGKMVGVITKTDVVTRISQSTGASCTMPAGSVMTRAVVACRPEQPLSEVWTIMKARQSKRLPVVDAEGKAIAVVSARQVVEAQGGRAGGGAPARLHHVHGLPVMRRQDVHNSTWGAHALDSDCETSG